MKDNTKDCFHSVILFQTNSYYIKVLTIRDVKVAKTLVKTDNNTHSKNNIIVRIF